MMNLTINDYILKNNKATYYKVTRDMEVKNIEASFIFELIYFKKFEEVLEEEKYCVKEKYKKISRMANLDMKTLEDRFFRSIVNQDKYHTVDLANELYLRDKDKFFDIMYSLSYIAEDENKLIKTFMFEYLCDKIGYNPYILKNLIVYFTKSCNKYIDKENKEELKKFILGVSKLYVLVYNLKNSKKLDIEGLDNLSKIKKIIYDELEREVL